MSQYWDTTRLPENEQFDYWHDGLCDAFITLKPERANHGSFVGKIKRDLLGDLSISNIMASEHTVCRTPKHIGSADERCFFLNLQIGGRSRTTLGIHDVVANPGDIILVDSNEPYKIALSEGFTVCSIKIPSHLLQRQLVLGESQTFCHIPANKEYGEVIFSYVDALLRESEYDGNDNKHAMLLVENFIGLIAIALDKYGTAPSYRGVSTQQLYQIKAIIGYIVSHIEDPDLNLNTVARNFNLSVRNIQRLFSLTGSTFSATVMRLRLDKCAQFLSVNNYQSRKINEIAYACGFNDLSYFGRGFKKQFGVSPKEYRRRYRH